MQALSACIHFFGRLAGWISRPFLKIRNLQMRSAMITLAITALVWIVAALVIPLAPFGDNSLCTNDGYAQYMPFLSEFWSICHGDGSFLYSFKGALGSNFYLTMAYYLFSPFTFLVLLFDKAQIPAAANLIIILKNILVACIMAWYLASKGKKPMPFLAASCAIAYGYGFYFLGYAVNFMWMDSIALVPLMLYGMERIATPRGRLFYLISLALGVLMNFYMGAIICIFLALYYVLIQWKWNKQGWIETGWFALCSICAVVIGGVVLIPVIQGMLMANASRMSPPDFEVFNDWQYFFSRLLPDAEVIRITHNRGTINLYMGTAVVFGTLLYLFSRQPKRRTKYALLFLCLVYLASTQISWLNYAFHGFYLQRQVPNRYGFLIGLLAAIMMYQGLLALSREALWKIVAAGVLSAIGFAGMAAYGNPGQLWLAFLLPGVVIVYLITAIFRRRALIGAMVIVESIGGLAMLAPGSMDSSYTDMARYIEAGKHTPGGRGEIVCSDIANAPMLYGMNGVSAFNSVINPQTASLLGKLGFAAGENYYRFFGFDPISALFFNVRSIVTTMDDGLPYPYEQSAFVEDLAIWTSPYDIPIGICLDNPQEWMGNTNKFDNNNVLYPNAFQTIAISGLLSGDATYNSDPASPYKVTDIEENDVTVLTLDPMHEDNLYVYAALPGTKSFTVHKNGKIIADNKYEGNIVYLGNVTEQDIITFSFKADSDKEEQTLKLQAALLPPEKTAEAAQFFIDRGLKNQQIAGNVITGTFSSDQERTMIFTLPFDEGWSATVNGQAAELSAWQDALVSIQVPAGESEIRLVYIPAGLKAGAILSAGGIAGALLIFALPLLTRRKRKSGNSGNPEATAHAKAVSGPDPQSPDSENPAGVLPEKLPAIEAEILSEEVVEDGQKNQDSDNSVQSGKDEQADEEKSEDNSSFSKNPEPSKPDLETENRRFDESAAWGESGSQLDTETDSMQQSIDVSVDVSVKEDSLQSENLAHEKSEENSYEKKPDSQPGFENGKAAEYKDLNSEQAGENSQEEPSLRQDTDPALVKEDELEMTFDAFGHSHSN